MARSKNEIVIRRNEKEKGGTIKIIKYLRSIIIFIIILIFMIFFFAAKTPRVVKPAEKFTPSVNASKKRAKNKLQEEAASKERTMANLQEEAASKNVNIKIYMFFFSFEY